MHEADRIERIAAALYQDMYNNSWGRLEEWAKPQWRKVAKVAYDAILCWEPISTAPKDGSPILAFVPSYFQGTGGQTVAHWMRGSRTPDGAWYDGQAWEIEPTLWQCLPPPPESERP